MQGPPTAAGWLAKTPLPHLLAYLMERRLTGTLELTHADGRGGTLVAVGGVPRKAPGGYSVCQ